VIYIGVARSNFSIFTIEGPSDPVNIVRANVHSEYGASFQIKNSPKVPFQANRVNGALVDGA